MIKSVGLDITADRLRAVECVKAKKDIIVTKIGEVPLTQRAGDSDIDILRNALKSLFKQMDIKVKYVRFGMPGASVFVRRSRILLSERKSLEDVIRLEATQAIPFSLNEVAWDYFLTKEIDQKAKKQRIAQEAELVLVAVKKDLIEQKKRVIESAGVSINEVDVRPLASYRCAQFTELAEDDAYRLFIMGEHNYTDVVLGRGNDIWLRSLPFSFLKDLSDLTPDKLQNWMNEIKRACEFYFLERNPENSAQIQEMVKESINSVMVAGSVGNHPSVMELCRKTFSAEVDVVKPFESFPLSDEAQQIVESKKEAELSSFVTCVGLAISALGEERVKVNLYKDSAQAKKGAFEKKLFNAASLVSGLCIIALGAIPMGEDIKEKKEFMYQLQEMVSEARIYRPKIVKRLEEHDEFKKKVDELYSIAVNRGIWLDVINGLEKALPDEIWIKELDVSRMNVDEVVGELTIKGNGPSYDEINRLVSALKLSRYFEDVKPISSSVVQLETAEEVVEFTITMGVKGKQYWGNN